MSVNISINATVGLDGVTAVDLSTPVGIVRGIATYVFPLVGIIDLRQIPALLGVQSDLYIQIASARDVPAPLGTDPAFSLIPTGPFDPAQQKQPLLDSSGFTGLPAPPVNSGAPGNTLWSAIVPQDELLLVETDPAAGPVPMLFNLSVWPYGEVEWPDLQCCHVWRPVSTSFPV